MDLFTEHRDLLFTVAYEITSSVTDAEDVVQETWLRWSADDRSDVQHPRAYLVRIATRQALNLVRSRTRRREDYIGPWLPEPLVTAPDIADDAVMAEAVSMGMLLVLESLSPEERAVFVLREVFAFEHKEIAEVLGKSDAAVRQIAHRARGAVQARRPRFDPDPAQAAVVLEKFWQAMGSGNLADLIEALAPDVVITSDGGGLVSTARRPVEGADKVARMLLGLTEKFGEAMTWESAVVNGVPGVLVRIDGALDTVGIVEVEDGRIARIYLIRNPEKLTHGAPVRVAR